jgi:XTP/dITP diphosphohydrolase
LGSAIVLASGNKHKLQELRAILDGYRILDLSDIAFSGEIVENGETFAQNALIKARTVHAFCGLTVIADDSGLCVERSAARPAFYSARYSGKGATDEKNNHKLLKALEGIENRNAVFVCAAAAVFDDGAEACEVGVVRGRIGYGRRGSGGFGYDPLFICDENGKTYAEMTAEEKNALSHRQRAFAKLKTVIDGKKETL